MRQIRLYESHRHALQERRATPRETTYVIDDAALARLSTRALEYLADTGDLVEARADGDHSLDAAIELLEAAAAEREATREAAYAEALLRYRAALDANNVLAARDALDTARRAATALGVELPGDAEHAYRALCERAVDEWTAKIADSPAIEPRPDWTWCLPRDLADQVAERVEEHRQAVLRAQADRSEAELAARKAARRRLVEVAMEHADYPTPIDPESSEACEQALRAVAAALSARVQRTGLDQEYTGALSPDQAAIVRAEQERPDSPLEQALRAIGCTRARFVSRKDLLSRADESLALVTEWRTPFDAVLVARTPLGPVAY